MLEVCPPLRRRFHMGAFVAPILPGQKVTPRVVPEDVVIRVAGCDLPLQPECKPVVQRCRLGEPLRGDFESVWEVVIRVPTGVLASERSVRMNEVRRELDRLIERCTKLIVQ